MIFKIISGSNIVGAIGGIATIFTSGVWDFAFCRFIVGIAYDNCFMMPYILSECSLIIIHYSYFIFVNGRISPFTKSVPTEVITESIRLT